MPLRLRHHLTNEEAARALELLRNGHSQRYVAGRFNVSLGSINRLWQRFQETGRSTRTPGKGRHRITSHEEDRFIRILACRNRQSSARSLAALFRDASHHALSDQTIRNRLHEAGMHARRPAARPIRPKGTEKRVWRFPRSTWDGAWISGHPCSSLMRAVSTFPITIDVFEFGGEPGSVLQTAMLWSTTAMVEGLSWCGAAFV